MSHLRFCRAVKLRDKIADVTSVLILAGFHLSVQNPVLPLPVRHDLYVSLIGGINSVELLHRNNSK